ncbi:hypothetical protein LOAG_14174 [Loa loa]|uniref:Uncharacterized protein n=1 Tax=Loa loa TaxID=7209 RepID=A0A1S0TJ67_LOALO|nr:hypothetical protein LOAG_14174 [Loa loa]EFO14348.1 hypothetical protein LOAG_14174 [Loa loa]
MSYQQSSFATQPSLLYQQHDDKNDKSSIIYIGNDDKEITLSLYNSDTTKRIFFPTYDDNSKHDSDEEFAIYACLRGLIKSKLISPIQKHDYAALFYMLVFFLLFDFSE